MKLSEVRTDIERRVWVKLCNDEKTVKKGQLCSLIYNRGKLQLITNGECIMIRCKKAFDEKDITIPFSRGYCALAEITNVAPDNSYCIRIIYIYGAAVNLSKIDLALDSKTLGQAKKLNLGDTYEKVSEALASEFIFQFDKASNDFYAFAYLSKVATDELRSIEQQEYEQSIAGESESQRQENSNIINDSDNSHSNAVSEDKSLSTNNIVIIGEKIQLAVREYPIGDETYLGCKRLIGRTNKQVNKAICLIKLDLSFSDADSPSVLQHFALEQMKKLNNLSDGYLATWDKYGAEEGSLLLKKSRAVGKITYTNVEPYKDGSCIEIFVSKDYREYISDNDSLALVSDYPEYLEDENISWEQYSISQLAEYKKKNGLSSNLDWGVKKKPKASDENETRPKKIDSDIIDIFQVKQNSFILKTSGLPENGKLIFSILGDEVQIKRRMSARERIDQATSAMPQLGVLIEEGGILPKKEKPKDIPALTQHVLDKIFPKNKPTDIQEEAIFIALNTPDIAIIQGPPGTGKTTVMAAVIERLNEISDKKNGVKGEILVSGYQHDAVDNVLSRLSVNSLPSVKFGQKQGDDDELSSSDEKIHFWRNDIAEKVKANNPELEMNAVYDSLHYLYHNYLSSPNSHKALKLLKHGLDSLEPMSGSALTTRLKSLRDKINNEVQPKSHNDIRCVRALRISPESFIDDGPQRAADLLNILKSELSENQLSVLQTAIVWSDEKSLDFLASLKVLKKTLLIKYKEDVRLSVPMVRHDVVALIQECLEYLTSNEHIKDPQNKILANHIYQLENNPNGIKKAIAEYNLVYGATTGQSEGTDLRNVKVGRKGGQVIFDTVMVDEAARAAPRDLMIPMVQAENRIILVGDHRQLPHMVEDSIVKSLQGKSEMSVVFEQHIKHSMFQYLITRLKKLEAQDHIPRTITLDAQFRSHPLLGEFASNQFYKSHEEGYRSDLPAHLFSHQLNGIENQAAVWVDVPHLLGNEEKDTNKSTYRAVEAKKIAKKLSEWIDSEAGQTLSFGIISFYKAQVTQIFKELVRYGITEKVEGGYQICEQYKMLRDETNMPIEERLRIGTVDSFQGMEFDIVLLSVVRSHDKNTLNNKNKHDRTIFGHLMSVNRLCVSMTRQKKALIVFGDEKFVSSARAQTAIPEVGGYLSLCKQKGLLLDQLVKTEEVTYSE